MQVLFGPGSQVGMMVKDWPMVSHIGMGKASDCRTILQVVREISVDIRALKGIGCVLKKLCSE